MKTPSGIELKTGQVWRELDNRCRREIEVVGFDESIGKVQIKNGHRVTRASVKRFNGKSHGYIFIR
jgi:hypothetical protein